VIECSPPRVTRNLPESMMALAVRWMRAIAPSIDPWERSISGSV